MSQFKNSIAQSNVNFPIETVITPIAGENYSRTLIFMNVANAATYLPGVNSVAAGDLIELNSANYGELTGGKLKNWLVPFFTKATTAKVGIAVFDTDTDNEAGGGRVVIPCGIYLTGGLRLRSSVQLYLEAGAYLKGSRNPDDYYSFGSRTHKRCFSRCRG